LLNAAADLRALREPVATPTPGQAASSLERQPNISVSRSSQPTPGESRDAPIIIDLSDSEDDTTIPPQQSPPLATIWRGDNPKQLVLKISSNRLSEVVVQPERRTTMRRFHQKAASEASSLATPRPTPLSVEVSDGDEERVPKRRLLKSPRCDKSFGRKPQASRHAQRHTSEFPRHSPRLQSASRSRRSRVYSQARSRVKRAKRATRRSASKQTAVRALEGLAIARLDADVRRPYLSLQARKDFLRGLKITHLNARHLPGSPEEGTILENGIVVHVDFSLKELNAVLSALSHLYGRPRTSHPLEAITSIVALWQRNGGTLENLVPTLRAEGLAIPGRLESDLLFFLRDVVSAADFKLIKFTRLLPIKLRRSPVSAVDSAAKTQRSVTTLTLQREMLGRLRSSQQTSSAQAHLLCCYEDHLQRQAEYIDSSGDIATICWVDTNRFFCGATAHSDAHNMQYNKPGNLLSGSLSANAVRSVAGHQIIRPVVTRGENATDSMRQTQDPWLYCSVTCTAYLAQYGKCFSGSYDHTVKIWEMSEDGALSTLCGTWRHEGNVNFVVTSQHHDLVATAADARRDAVRVYDFEPNGIEWSSYDSFEAASQSKNLHDKWAYYPATMQWASCPRISHFLLVGYSPRSLDCLADDVPRDKVNTGELCVWNAQTGVPIPMWGTHSQNVFEVAWHPAQPIFFAATSPTGQSKPGVKTQVRMFVLEDKQWGFHQLKSLDCPAADINEITVMPNGVVDCYVTASCTDGNTYVWDTAFGDDPIHVLPHGRSIDDQGLGNAHGENDNGVKFAAWGASIDRFYTGATDGVVKVWNVRAAHDEVFIRDLVTLSGGVTTGKFSPDYNTLLIGDATGKVHVLSAMGKFGGNDEDAGTVGDKSLSREQIIPHSPVPPPTAFETTEELVSDQSGIAIARCFIEKFQLAVSSDEYIGAVQGPDYNETRLYYDRTKYVDGNGNDTEGWSLQELDAKRRERYEVHGINLPTLPEVGSSNNALHMANLARDVEHTLTPGTMGQLQHEGIDFDFEPDHDFDFELGPVVGQAISTRAQGVDKDGDSYMSSGDEEDEQPLSKYNSHNRFRMIANAICS
jgi:WD40 repeat protein